MPTGPAAHEPAVPDPCAADELDLCTARTQERSGWHGPDRQASSGRPAAPAAVSQRAQSAPYRLGDRHRRPPVDCAEYGRPAPPAPLQVLTPSRALLGHLADRLAEPRHAVGCGGYLQ